LSRLYSRLLALSALTICVVLTPSAGQADPYKWCAIYSGGRGGGGSNCGFVTLEQCRATVSGIGGFCHENLFYTGPAEAPVKRKRKRRDD
jgi:Protein of unknown function (DUF3551)